VLAVLAEKRRTLGVAEIAEAAGLPSATAHRILATLTDQDWVEQNPLTGKYRLGFGLLGVGSAAMAYSPMVEKSRQVLSQIAEMSEFNSYLGVLVGARISYISRAPGTKSPRHDFHLGFIQPAHSIAAGKAILAFLPYEERERLLNRKQPLPRYTDKTLTSFEGLESEFETIRQTGVAYDHGELKDTYRGIAAPVRGADGRVIASITTGGDVTLFPPEQMARIADELRVLTVELSIALEYAD
jgi:IclR family acetate operon transcriptional repressor